MTSTLYHELSLLNNFGIEENDNLDTKTRLECRKNYLEQLSLKKCLSLFYNVEEYLFDEKISTSLKEEIIMLTIHGIGNYSFLEENLSELPVSIKDIYESYLEFGRLNLIFEKISSSEVTMVNALENILTDFMNFILKTKHELFIHNCYPQIKNFTQTIIKYLNQKNVDDIKHIELINYDIIEFLKTRVVKIEKENMLT